MKLRYFLGAFALVMIIAFGACSSDNDDVNPDTPGDTELPGDTGNPDDGGNDDGGNGDGGNDDGTGDGGAGDGGNDDGGAGDGGNDDGTGGSGSGDGTGDGTGDGGNDDGFGEGEEPQGDLLTAKVLKGVWNGSDSQVYYFYGSGNLYIESGDSYGVATWTIFETTRTLKIGDETITFVYDESASTITLKNDLVLTLSEEYLPDETHFILVENKEIVTSIGGMSSVTWTPEEI